MHRPADVMYCLYRVMLLQRERLFNLGKSSVCP